MNGALPVFIVAVSLLVALCRYSLLAPNPGASNNVTRKLEHISTHVHIFASQPKQDRVLGLLSRSGEVMLRLDPATIEFTPLAGFASVKMWREYYNVARGLNDAVSGSTLPR